MKLLHLQGLRALAIVSVCLFHFLPSFFPNGYLGVDQFFLLSGYLMTMMLNRNNRHGASDIADFLYRRLKRITPLYYLITILILGSLKWAPPISLETNYSSAPKALFFGTNLFRPTNNDGYFEKLGLAVDMFTHTWSLALEVQFYLIFPFFFIFVLCLPRFQSEIVSMTIFSSLILYFVADDFLSFNNVFCRMWQFLAGMFVFNLPKSDYQPLEKDSPEECKPIGTSHHHSPDIVIGYLFCAVFLLFWSQRIEPNFARLNITVLTALIIHLGPGCWPLENKAAVFVGEVSYCWYLVHWPVVAHLRLNHIDGFYGICMGLLASFVISVVVHLLYEKQYLYWSKGVIVTVVSFLLIANVGLCLFTKPESSAISQSPSLLSFGGDLTSVNSSSGDSEECPYYHRSDRVQFTRFGYENMTKGNIPFLLRSWERNDWGLVIKYRKEGTQGKIPELYHFNGGSNTTNASILVIGNSIAMNTIGLVRSECREKYNKLSLAAVAGCEPILQSLLKAYPGFNCKPDGFYLKTVQEMQPDVLFIIFRHLDTLLIENGTNPFDDLTFKKMVTRLRQIEKAVKKKIYIVDAWPHSPNNCARMVKYLEDGIRINKTSFETMGQTLLVAKQRMARLVNSCEKCELFDFATMFYFKGKFSMYDPEHFISFVTTGPHFTTAGLERLRPLFRDLCDRI